jgi:RimJ/RimL family protein N-acetyltransferase
VAGSLILETDRLLLREFDEGDAEAFYVLGSDPAITRYTGDPGGGLSSIEHAVQVLLAHPMADYVRHGFGRWACVHKATGTVIGFAGLKHLDELGEVDIGYRLLPAYWGAGLATEAGRAAVADFDPAPQLDAFWADALKPFRAVPRKEFGFTVVVRVVEDLEAEIAPRK